MTAMFLLDLRVCLVRKTMLPRLEKDNWVIKSSSNKLSVGILVKIIGEPWGSDPGACACAGDNLPLGGELGDLSAAPSCPISG